MTGGSRLLTITDWGCCTVLRVDTTRIFSRTVKAMHPVWEAVHTILWVMNDNICTRVMGRGGRYLKMERGYDDALLRLKTAQVPPQ